MTDETVSISVSRLKELEGLEAKQHKKMDRLKMLEERRKADPEKYNKKTLEYYHKHRDEINAKRRAIRAAKKAASGAAIPPE